MTILRDRPTLIHSQHLVFALNTDLLLYEFPNGYKRFGVTSIGMSNGVNVWKHSSHKVISFLNIFDHSGIGCIVSNLK